tara:strand:+ start:18 stop:689 length:672 start_codon:yes stop_codon:yes gene_type:complete
MFHHTHPYEPFNLENANKLIVGTLPPPRFTSRELLIDDVDFCYGSRNGMLWPILDKMFDLNLLYDNSNEAVQQRYDFLIDRKIGICDVVNSARRDKIDASDLGMQEVELRPLIKYLQQYPQIDTLLFTGGNSKNGPEYFFRRLAKKHNISLKAVNKEVPRVHQFQLPEAENPSRIITTISLTAPSGAANRAIGSMALYKKIKDEDPEFTTFDFRVMQYRPFFE